MTPRAETRAHTECELLKLLSTNSLLKCHSYCRALALTNRVTFIEGKSMLSYETSNGKCAASAQIGCHDKYFGLAATGTGIPGHLNMIANPIQDVCIFAIQLLDMFTVVCCMSKYWSERPLWSAGL